MKKKRTRITFVPKFSTQDATIMTYIAEFQNRINSRDFSRALALWKEFCEVESTEEGELKNILEMIRDSDMSSQFGPFIELALPLVMMLPTKEERIQALSPLYDIQTSNSSKLWELLQTLVQEEFGKVSFFQEKMRLSHARDKTSFQGALSNFLLLNHCEKGNFVYHKAGWGVGVIRDSSFLREQISVEFENLSGAKRDMPFKSGFKSLLPLSKDHFLAMRFACPARLEEMASSDPIKLITKILSDLGPKTALEIKDLISGYVVDDALYAKWWQQVRTKLKKDSFIESPESAKQAFSLRKNQLTLHSRVHDSLSKAATFSTKIAALWNLLRDFPQAAKETATQEKIMKEIGSLLQGKNLLTFEKLELYFLHEMIHDMNEYGPLIQEEIKNLSSPLDDAAKIEIVGLKKRFLQAIREYRADWKELFKKAFLQLDPSFIKEYSAKELCSEANLKDIEEAYEHLLEHPLSYPETFVWVFQKVIQKESPVFTEERDIERFFENFLLLLRALESKPEKRDLVKKMCGLITGNRFKLIRDFFKYTDIPFIREFLLLSSKCHSFTEHDLKVLLSLAEVAHPDIAVKEEKSEQNVDNVLWTTEEGYHATQKRIEHIGTVEMVENAREIEAARALGDLRENAEYKFALERRSRLQLELKTLSDQFHRARILTKNDVDSSFVSVGTKVKIKDNKGHAQEYTILGPWDANVDKHILSNQSKLAQSMLGARVGESFSFRGDTFTVQEISSIFAS